MKSTTSGGGGGVIVKGSMGMDDVEDDEDDVNYFSSILYSKAFIKRDTLYPQPDKILVSNVLQSIFFGYYIPKVKQNYNASYFTKCIDIIIFILTQLH